MTKLYKNCLLFKALQMRVYTFETRDDMTKMVAEVQSGCPVTSTHGDITETWHNPAVIEIHIYPADAVLLMFEDNVKRHEMQALLNLLYLCNKASREAMLSMLSVTSISLDTSS
jgi:hypothetical protein